MKEMLKIFTCFTIEILQIRYYTPKHHRSVILLSCWYVFCFNNSTVGKYTSNKCGHTNVL